MNLLPLSYFMGFFGGFIGFLKFILFYSEYRFIVKNFYPSYDVLIKIQFLKNLKKMNPFDGIEGFSEMYE